MRQQTTSETHMQETTLMNMHTCKLTIVVASQHVARWSTLSSQVGEDLNTPTMRWRKGGREGGTEGGTEGGREGEEAKGTHHVSSQYTRRGSPHNYVGAKREREGDREGGAERGREGEREEEEEGRRNHKPGGMYSTNTITTSSALS